MKNFIRGSLKRVISILLCAFVLTTSIPGEAMYAIAAEIQETAQAPQQNPDGTDVAATLSQTGDTAVTDTGGGMQTCEKADPLDKLRKLISELPSDEEIPEMEDREEVEKGM